MECQLEPTAQLSAKRCQSQLCRHQGDGNTNCQTAKGNGELHEDPDSGYRPGGSQQGQGNRGGGLDLFCMWIRAQQCKVHHMQKQEVQKTKPKPTRHSPQGQPRARAKCTKQKWTQLRYPKLVATFFLCLLGNQLCQTIPRQQTLN